jgi:Leucine-rich repeat (LRR) protein
VEPILLPSYATPPNRYSSLHFNQLESLPGEIGQCSSLVWLSLNANRLQQLPPEIGNLTNIVRL